MTVCADGGSYTAKCADSGGEMTYVPLFCKTNYSFLEGASHPEEVVEESHRLGLESVAITDRDGLYGIVRAHLSARELGMKIIVGAEVSIDDGSHIVLLAQDRRGYANLCRLISKGRLRSEKGKSCVSWSEICAAASGLLALWGGRKALLGESASPHRVAVRLRRAFGDRLYALLVRHRRAEEVESERRLVNRAERWKIPLIAAVEVLYHRSSRRRLQDVLTCIRHNTSLCHAGRKIKGNGEHALRTPRAFEALFYDHLDAVERTRSLARRCTFRLDEIRYRFPVQSLPNGKNSADRLRELTISGAHQRYGRDIPEDVIRQVERELSVIVKLDYCGYFLGMWEIVDYCRRHEILCQGRGSAANSAVCYCLGITAIDPVRMNLLFERFISEERAEPPDIDLDIQHHRREEVIQYVYRKYGREYAAMVANFVRYRPRSAVRDVGKVLGLAQTSLDRLAKMLSSRGHIETSALASAGLSVDDPLCKHLFELSNEILDFPRHLSIHPGGFLLGHEPVCEVVPIENATMKDRTVIQWDKDDVEAMGLFKVDLLGLGALTQLDQSFRLLEKRRSLRLSMATIPAQDEATFEMMRRADTVGVFQIESRAQMAMLPRLRPETFYDLVIEISIVRPGPISGGMVHPYLNRRAGREDIEFPHPSLKPVLEKTLGVPLFQEQVMKLAVVAADYTPGEADQLRRDMAAWRRAGRIEKHRDRLISRMEAKGIDRAFGERIFEQIRGFGEYGFPESHAASFALIAYATSYLKCHFPAVFACTLLNSQPMGFYSPATIIEDAKRHGVKVYPVDVARSEWECTLRTEKNGDEALQIGARFIKAFHKAEWEMLCRVRSEAAFRDLEDLVRRSGLNESALLRIAEAGALESLGVSRRTALWEVRRLVRTRCLGLPLSKTEAAVRFQPLDFFETVEWDYGTTDHSARGHPMQSLRAELSATGLPDARGVNAMGDGDGVRYAGAVICRQRPGTAKGVTFMTMEDETGFVNVVVWKKVFEKYCILLKTASFLGISGKVQSQDGVVHVVAEQLWIPAISRTPRRRRSRDFH